MASKFWVGGAGTWDNSTTTHWAISSGGAGGTAAPVNGDSVTFDGSSGGGTVTVDTTINGMSFSGITCGAFTGTLDFSINNPSITLTGTFSLSGSGTRTINLGSGTFTSSYNGLAVDNNTTTGETFSGASCTLAFTNTAAVPTFNPGGKTWGTVNIAASSGVNIGSGTITTLSATSPATIIFNSAATISNAFTINGSPSAFNTFYGSAASPVAVTVPVSCTASWANFKNLNFSNTVTATNSFNSGGNTNVSVTGPSVGGSVGIIGS